MAIVPNKRLLLIAFLLLFFISTIAQARNLREIKEGGEKGQSSEFKPNHEGTQTQVKNDDLLDTMDYTPASKNPPIHN
ncbi:uncharacterized protein LOC127103181 [Lathyrus oleraceus]|uniref:uncharacterized protein LOC127103181 n=1 Tax=Pisum sativum TaxID=3888 RepID=UPI001FC5C492|nr:uncharacterized protein LOC127103181 [Pisum sativum]